MRLLPAPMAVRIGTVAVAAAIAVVGGTTAASAAAPGSAGHSQPPRHPVYRAAKQRDQQRPTASPSASASASPAASPSPAVVKIATALSIGVTGEVTHNQRTRAVIDGRLFEPTEADHGVGGKLVFLLRQAADGHWFLVGQEFTGPRGGVAFPVHVFKTATFELVFRGTRHLTGAVSAATTVS